MKNIAENIPRDYLRYMWATVHPAAPKDVNTQEGIGELIVCYMIDWLALLRFHSIVYDPLLYSELMAKSKDILFNLIELKTQA